jgi:hypothetical protein
MITYSWKLLEAPVNSGITDSNIYGPEQRSPSFMPDVIGDYTVELVVSDGEDIDSDTVVITCEELPQSNPGDLNGDGVVDNYDYNVFRTTLGKCTGEKEYLLQADYDNDGCVSLADYRIWYGYYRNYINQ